MLGYHVHIAEYVICYFAIFVVSIHEYILRNYVGKNTLSGLPKYTRFFVSSAIIHSLLLYLHRSVLSSEGTSVAVLAVGLVPAVVISLWKRKWLRAMYYATITTIAFYKHIEVDSKRRDSPDPKQWNMMKISERLLPVSFIIPCLHPDLGLLLRGFTAPLWHVMAVLFLFEMEVLYLLGMDFFVGHTVVRKETSLGTQFIGVCVLINALWENSLSE
eukprot:PhF_6_TR6289/c0_g1_i2/m.9525